MDNKSIIVEDKTFEIKDILFVFALETESGEYFKEYNVCYTGIGKVRATYYLTEAIYKYNPKLIINLGSVGSHVFKKGDLVCCNKFIQRDMDLVALGFNKYETPFTKNSSIILSNGLKYANLALATCGTGDQFESNLNSDDYEVVDMESYALAWVAKEKNIPFLSIKYITDGANDTANDEWKKEVLSAPLKFSTLFKIH